ncbi:MAG: hypothetical protein PVSMB1_15710 [Gemmatimonadaceae bacterium]
MATSESGQTYSNHARFFPLFHFFAAPILLANLLWALWQIVRAPSLSTVWSAIVAAGLVGGLTAARLMALTVQDRVIRLEMRLRLREVLPADLQARIPELTPRQLIGLRFASNAELPELVPRVLSGSLGNATDIKKAVTHWQGDYLRA